MKDEIPSIVFKILEKALLDSQKRITRIERSNFILRYFKKREYDRLMAEQLLIDILISIFITYNMYGNIIIPNKIIGQQKIPFIYGYKTGH